MRHLILCVRLAAHSPRVAFLGVREFRSDLTTSHDDLADRDAYDAGRELAHVATARRFDPAA